MNRVFLLVFTTILYTNYLVSFEICGNHYSDIQTIRNVAQTSLLESHRKGGNLFRSSYVPNPEETVYDLFKWRKNYSEFSLIFREYLSICQPEGKNTLYEGYSQVGDLFYNLYTECINKHSSTHARYERSHLFYERELYQDCLSDLQYVLELEYNRTADAKLSLFASKAYFEAKQYPKAIEQLSLTISREPTNKEAYFYMALAGFETGQFDQAIDSYLKSEKSKHFSRVNLKTSLEFKEGILKGLIQGQMKAEPLPSLSSTSYGLERTLWAGLNTSNHPINTLANFINACEKMCEEIADYHKHDDWNEVKNQVENEIQRLSEKYDSLSDSERGALLGYILGKFGVDIFAGGSTLQTISTFKKLKEALRACNLETLVLSDASKEAIVAEASKHYFEREKFFKTVKYDYEEHNKQVLGHIANDEKKGIWHHPNPEDLLRRFAGTGNPEKRAFGILDYEETVDFMEHIGLWKSLDGSIVLPTTKGRIHYGKKGAHIVLANPNF